MSFSASIKKANELFGVSILKDTPATLASPVTLTNAPRVDKSAMAVTCVLTSATPDRQGDIIDPTGGDLTEHETNPVVLFHHGKTHRLPIGKAEDRDGNYTVRLVKSPSGDDLLIGTTFFSQSNQFAQDVFHLIAEDIMRGVSIGFDPPGDDSQVIDLGPSPALDRHAFHFKDGWKLLEYSHTPIGVNRDALTVKVEKALEGTLKLDSRLLKALQPFATPRKTVVAVTKGSSCAGMSKKQKAAIAINKAKTKKKPMKKGYLDSIDESQGIPSSVPPCPMCGGDSVPLTRNTIYGYECQQCGGSHGLAESHQRLGWPSFKPKGMHVIVKAADQTFLRLKKVNKAMEDYADEDTDVNPVDVAAQPDPMDDDDVTDTDTVTVDEDGPTPAVKSMYDAAQGLMDICTAIEDGMKKSEHSKARKYATKLCSDLRKIAEEAKGFGDKVATELGSMPSGDEEVTETESETEPMETDEDGAIQTKSYTPRRWTYSDLASQPRPTSTVTDAELARENKSLKTENKSLKSENGELSKELNRVLDRLEAIRRNNNR